ncbi:uncharacterized protein LOC129570671 [Sitodiplosis mosellana]|uniref:uncharacterized protein LOC129570671 n=1 Tax=Sitodiplosis mosellana TaxID=263140 RepID=UPI0024443E72|nr:uncharacterized protein LOC129570671 [Sitodiplosis mosellana]
MDRRKKTVSQKRPQEETNTPANKRFKSSEAVSADTKATTNEHSSNKTAQQPMKIYYTRLQRHMEEEEKQAKLVPEPIVFTTKLTDVNADCLEHIFKRLSLTDLLNVANSNKQLKPAADLAFKSQFRKRSIKIDMERKIVGFSEEDTAEILWSFRFKLLRCFGHLITKLEIAYVHKPSQEDLKRAAHIDRYVNEYCADSLVEIRFEGCKASTLDNLTKPFTQVETLGFVGCELVSKLSELDKWFPKVRRLNFLRANELSGCNDIAVHFPNLLQLSLFLPFDEIFIDNNRLNEEHFAELLRLNPNVRSLFIYGYIDAKFFQSVSEHLQHLETLTICALDDDHISDFGNDSVHFPSVKKLSLINVVCERFPLTFDKLECLLAVLIDMDETLTNFISEHKTLTKLIYSGNEHGKEGALLKIASPALVEVDFGYCAFPLDEVVTFMEKCTSLKKLSLGFNDEKDYKAVQNRLSKEWRGTNMKSIYDAIAVTMER